MKSEVLNHDIISCRRCTRLVDYSAEVAQTKRKSFINDNYWGRPVPNFGDLEEAELLIVGLAPAAHGGHRTGRMFTGDRSGDWLYRALFRQGFASQPECINADDGLWLKGCAVTAVGHCAPPQNKLLPDEIHSCSDYLQKTFKIAAPKLRVVISLGAVAWKACWNVQLRDLKENQLERVEHPPSLSRQRMPDFQHGVEYKNSAFGKEILWIASYHPSQQNTFTKKLTEKMFDDIFIRARSYLGSF